MRYLPKALLFGLALLFAGIAILWMQRAALLEWGATAVLEDRFPGPVTLRIGAVSFDSIAIEELRLAYFGTVSAERITVGIDWPDAFSLRIGAVRAARIAADLQFSPLDQIMELAGLGDAETRASSPYPDFGPAALAIDEIDLHVETPEGYLLADGAASLTAPLTMGRQPLAAALLRSAPDLSLSLTVGVSDLEMPELGALGLTGGLSIAFRHGVGQIRSALPPALRVTVPEESQNPFHVPPGGYGLQLGSDPHPLNATFRLVERDGAVGLEALAFDSFPFLIELDHGHVSGSAHVGAVDPAALLGASAAPPATIDAFADIRHWPLPGGGEVSARGSLALEIGANRTFKLLEGFEAAADLSATAVRASADPRVRDLLGFPLTIRALTDLQTSLASTADATRLSLQGNLSAELGPVAAHLDGPADLHLGQDTTFSTHGLNIGLRPDAGLLPVLEPLSLAVDRPTINISGPRLTLDTARLALESRGSRISGSAILEAEDGLARLALTQGSAAIAEPPLAIPEFDLEIAAGPGRVTAHGALQRILLEEVAALKRPLAFRADADLSEDVTRVSLSGDLDGRAGFEAHGEIAADGATVRFETAPLLLGDAGVAVSSLTDLVDLGSMQPRGAVRASGSIAYDGQDLSGVLDIGVDELGVRLGDGSTISVRGTVSFDPFAFPATLRPATLIGRHTSAYLGEIPFEESMSIRPSGEIDLHELRASFLDGEIRVFDTVADPQAGTVAGKIHAEAISLTALAELLDVEGLDTSGRISGPLNFELAEDSVVLHGGDLRATTPGILRYQGEALRAAASSDENLKLLVQALENFHYEALSLSIDIPEFGEGVIALNLEGANPDVLDGHPFDVTVNLESDYGKLIRTFLSLYREVDLILRGSVR